MRAAFLNARHAISQQFQLQSIWVMHDAAHSERSVTVLSGEYSIVEGEATRLQTAQSQKYA